MATTYKGKTVPPFTDRGKAKAISLLLGRKARPFCILSDCPAMRCDGCLYKLSHEELALSQEITLEWYLKNNYFTKSDVLEAVFDGKNNT